MNEWAARARADARRRRGRDRCACMRVPRRAWGCRTPPAAQTAAHRRYVSVFAFFMPMSVLRASYDTNRMAFWGTTFMLLAACSAGAEQRAGRCVPAGVGGKGGSDER